MVWLACTNQRYEEAPIRGQSIEYFPRGTILYQPENLDHVMGDPDVYILDPSIYLYPDNLVFRSFLVVEHLPYVEGLPENNPVGGLCWECNPQEVVCFSDDLDENTPHPCAWWDAPFLYLCNGKGYIQEVK